MSKSTGESPAHDDIEESDLLDVDELFDDFRGSDYWCGSSSDGVFTKLGVWRNGAVDLFSDTSRSGYPRRWRDDWPDATIDLDRAHLGTLAELLRGELGDDVVEAFTEGDGWRTLIGRAVHFATRCLHIEGLAESRYSNDIPESIQMVIDELRREGDADDVVDIGQEVLGDDEALFTPRWAAIDYFETLLGRLTTG